MAPTSGKGSWFESRDAFRARHAMSILVHCAKSVKRATPSEISERGRRELEVCESLIGAMD